MEDREIKIGRKFSRRVSESENSWGEVRDTLFLREGERQSPFCWEVPRVLPFVLLIRVVRISSK
jgi:hypothetical protein